MDGVRRGRGGRLLRNEMQKGKGKSLKVIRSVNCMGFVVKCVGVVDAYVRRV